MTSHPSDCDCMVCLTDMTQSREQATRTEYALSKQVPDIACHAVFETNYGQLTLDYEDSQKVAALVERLLRKKLETLAKAARS